MIKVGKMTDNNILAEKSINFAIRIVKCYTYIRDTKKEEIMSRQMYRSGTSIGANIHEAIQAQSKSDFVSKLGISLKEASETIYWLKLLNRTNYLDDNMFESLKTDCDELIRITVASIKTAKKNMA
jgi:four helix bundle protein